MPEDTKDPARESSAAGSSHIGDAQSPDVAPGQSPDTVPEQSYVGRGGIKLAAALNCFKIDPAAMACADLGSNIGGFVDCLLQRGAARVHAVDTSYGQLAWTLRKDARVVVHERTNALHLELPEKVRLVTIDVGWTPQRLILPQARKLLQAGGCIVTLIKPHYEADKRLLRRGVLPDHMTDAVVERVVTGMVGLGFDLLGLMESPIRGQAGNRECLAHLAAGDPAGPFTNRGHSTQ